MYSRKAKYSSASGRFGGLAQPFISLQNGVAPLRLAPLAPLGRSGRLFPCSVREGGVLTLLVRLPAVRDDVPSTAIRSPLRFPLRWCRVQSCSTSNSPGCARILVRGFQISEPKAVFTTTASEIPCHTHDAGCAVGILRLRLIFALGHAKINPRSG